MLSLAAAAAAAAAAAVAAAVAAAAATATADVADAEVVDVEAAPDAEPADEDDEEAVEPEAEPDEDVDAFRAAVATDEELAAAAALLLLLFRMGCAMFGTAAPATTPDVEAVAALCGPAVFREVTFDWSRRLCEWAALPDMFGTLAAGAQMVWRWRFPCTFDCVAVVVVLLMALRRRWSMIMCCSICAERARDTRSCKRTDCVIGEIDAGLTEDSIVCTQ